ncbi:MAG: NMO domain-containing protein [Burkholderia sp.]|jgi:nitronate monooxygenase
MMTEQEERRAGLTALLGIERPVLSAPMRKVATPEFVAAVSEAGGLGVVPAFVMSPADIEAFAAKVRSLTAKPFAVALEVQPRTLPDPKAIGVFADGISALLSELGLPDGTDGKLEEAYDLRFERAPRFGEQFEAACGARPAAMLSVFGGFREPEADALRARGIVNMGAATTLREAKVLRAAKADAIVCQGSEAAGPRWAFEDADTAMVGLMALVPAAARATGLPVVAAGGIARPEQAKAAAALGAAGVMAGTAFITAAESGAGKALRDASLYASAADTVMTRVYDGCFSRVLKNGLVEALADYETHTAPRPLQGMLMRALSDKAEALGRFDLTAMPLGQSAGRSAWRSAAEAVKALWPADFN